MIDDVLKEQLAYMPKLEGASVPEHAGIIAGGMGGSGLAALSAQWLGAEGVVSHRSYDLPTTVPEGALAVAVSYSGNTEETLSFADAVLERGMPLAVVTSGGALLERAKEHNLPHVSVPSGFVPRDALISLTRAFLTFTDTPALLDGVSVSESTALDDTAATLADALAGSVPLIYASTENALLAYLWKITFNETAKIPAFNNVFPEWNHNELQGIDPQGPLAATPLQPVLLSDSQDDARIAQRFDVFAQTYQERGGAAPLVVDAPDGNKASTFVYHWALVRTCAHLLAEKYGIEPDATPLIESFKKAL